MIVVLKIKDTDNIIGLKEDIIARLEDIVDVESIDIKENLEKKEYFMAQEIRQMSPAEVYKNYDKICKSIKRWV